MVSAFASGSGSVSESCCYKVVVDVVVAVVFVVVAVYALFKCFLFGMSGV